MLDFDRLLDYALDNRLRALIAEIVEGWAVPAFEQPCRDCGQIRFFRRIYTVCERPGASLVQFGYWFEQCAVRHPLREKEAS